MMEIKRALNFAGNNFSFQFMDGDSGVHWYGKSQKCNHQGDEIHVSGMVLRGPKKLIEKTVSMTYSIKEGCLSLTF